MGLLSNKEVILKVFSVCSGVMMFLSGITKVYALHLYVYILVCVYLMVFAIVMVGAEISPYLLENYLSLVFPFLCQRMGKGMFYIILGTFCFGEEMGLIGIISGAMMLVAGILTVVFSCMVPQESSAKMDIFHETPGYKPPEQVR